MRSAANKAAQAEAATGAGTEGTIAAAVRRPARGAALWATIGFVSGAVFWHAVGFWTFMSELVLNGREASASQDLPLAGADIETGSLPRIYHVNPQNCVSLVLDRGTNYTAARPCPREGMALRLDTESEREDIAVIADAGLR